MDKNEPFSAFLSGEKGSFLQIWTVLSARQSHIFFFFKSPWCMFFSIIFFLSLCLSQVRWVCCFLCSIETLKRVENNKKNFWAWKRWLWGKNNFFFSFSLCASFPSAFPRNDFYAPCFRVNAGGPCSRLNNSSKGGSGLAALSIELDEAGLVDVGWSVDGATWPRPAQYWNDAGNRRLVLI